MILVCLLLLVSHVLSYEWMPSNGYGSPQMPAIRPVVSPGMAGTRGHLRGGEDYEEGTWDFNPNIPGVPPPAVSHKVIYEVPGTAAPQPSNFVAPRQPGMLLPQMTSTSPPATDSGRPSGAYEINFCDKFEFPDQLLATYGLQRIEHFIWNTSCSSTFYQCSIGQTFVLRCPSESQAFDSSITNCNFRNAVKVCPEFDPVLHCAIKDSCSEMEFACCSMPQQCLPISKRCDGHRDCADGDDENNCPSCSRYEFACVKTGRCIPAEKRCDGVPDDCNDGSNFDELGCNRDPMCVGKFMCHLSQQGPPCIEWADHCNGVRNCAMGEDELNCRHLDAKLISCENQQQSIPRQNWCDGTPHCNDGSDEKYCY
ncbi:Low-density lipoprotein receptor domain class A [Ancylostoma caninum]|uniref:Low-density lipoprotein receptor domain class A n=1 Tax=Ancylostoma caninum TaxID=29170 RepID=A0A368G1Z1_ANCCA|nr:Low-density lipoprotein receptor domain class A [Ancylostoma caninum]